LATPFSTPWQNNTPPQHTNEEGTKFWLDQQMQNYAISKEITDIQCLFVETPTGYRTRIITKGQEILTESTQLEAIACYIDMLRASANYDKHEQKNQ
jgi:hypothetical protein